jgi:hypothetical protein
VTRAVFALLLSVAAPSSVAIAQAPATDGYEMRRNPDTVQQAPPGFVGRKTTESAERFGNTTATEGRHGRYTMTFGTFVRRCPTAEGVVEGTYEYHLRYVEFEQGTQVALYDRHMVAELKGHVGNDAMLDHVDVNGTFTSQSPDFPATSRPVRDSYRVIGIGDPDWDAMRSIAAATEDVAAASVVPLSAVVYVAAQAEWTSGEKAKACVEFAFDPRSGDRALGASQAATVSVELRTKERDPGRLVADATVQAEPLQGIGSVAPRRVQSRQDAPVTFSYTASANPRKGHGFGVAARSRAGVAEAEWKIAEPELVTRFDLRLTQRGEGIIGDIHVSLPDTKLLAEQDGAYRGAGSVVARADWNAVGCTMNMNFTSPIRIAARAIDAERTRFRLEIVAERPQEPATMRCPDIDLTQTAQMPFAAWVRGPAETPATLGQTVPLTTAVDFGGFVATLNGTLTLSPPVPQ